MAAPVPTKYKLLCLKHRHLKNIDCLTAHVFFISTVNGCSKKKKKRSLFCAALVAGTINKLEQSIFAPSISMVWNHHNLFYQIQNALAFNWDTCCHLALCLWLLPFHWSTSWAFHSIGGFLSLTTNKSLGSKDLQGRILNLSVALLTIKKLYDIATWSISKISVDDLPNLSSLRYWRRGKIS